MVAIVKGRAHGVTGQCKRQVTGIAFAQNNIFSGKGVGGDKNKNEDERDPFQTKDISRLINNFNVKCYPFAQSVIRTLVPVIPGAVRCARILGRAYG